MWKSSVRIWNLRNVWIYGELMQTLLTLAALCKATVIFGFWGAAMVLLICALVIVYQLLGPLILKLLF